MMIGPDIKKDDIKGLFKDKKARKWLVLTFLLILLIILIIVNIILFFGKETHNSPSILYCEDCNIKEVKGHRLECNCPKCKKPMGYLWKCIKCDFEWQINPSKLIKEGTLEERRKRNVQQYSCPNCKSVETFRVTENNKDIIQPKKK